MGTTRNATMWFMTRLWMRHEIRPTECRAPIVPADAAQLVSQGIQVTVEQSPQRAFPLSDYTAAGCHTAPAGSWVDAPRDHYIVGIKELPDQPDHLVHRHVFFGHAYKGQAGAAALLGRFAAGGGQLLDIEYLVNDNGRRLAAFGYWAGYAGAALAVLRLRGRLSTPLAPSTRQAVDASLRPLAGDPPARAVVIGAWGRSGRGACEALATAGITPTRWDMAHTRQLDRPALLGHDILVNSVLTTKPHPPFITAPDVADPQRRLRVIADVTADVSAEHNLLPIYAQNTTWEQPVLRLADQPPLEIIAIDNLPSLLPVEASTAFSAELTPVLAELSAGGEQHAPAWQRCADTFRTAATALAAT